MRIIAIHDGHNATACYLEDGKLIFMVSEERFTNKKNQGGYPANSIQWILQKNEIDLKDIDYIAFPHLVAPIDYTKSYGEYSPRRVLFMLLSKTLPNSVIGSNKMIKPYLKFFGSNRKARLKSYAKNYNFDYNKILQVEHHTAHGYAALYGSGFQNQNEPCLIFTCDNSGDGLSSSVSIWDKNNGYSRIQRTQSFHSMGELYSRVTQFLGMKAGEHEYKIMGMAPYVSEEYYKTSLDKFLKYINFDRLNGCIINKKIYGYGLLKKFQSDFALTRFDNISAGIQKHFEYIITNWVTHWAKKTGIRKAVFGGGSFMNVKTNMLISQMAEFDQVYFFPSCGDESTALGAAYKIAEDLGEKNIEPLKLIYLGPEFDNDEIEKLLLKYAGKLDWKKYENIESQIAALLADFNIVARFKGPSEWGARALGGRSILCRADDMKIIHRLNKSIKMRDFWMPFAPSILDEDASDYIVNSKNIPAQFMILSFPATEKAKREITAALHPFDHTCRPQIVDKDQNSSYYALLKHFKEITGFGGFLNTSFNLHGFPIVGNPELAINTFLNSGLDYLALENFLIKAKPGIQPSF